MPQPALRFAGLRSCVPVVTSVVMLQGRRCFLEAGGAAGVSEVLSTYGVVPLQRELGARGLRAPEWVCITRMERRYLYPSPGVFLPNLLQGLI